MTKGGEERVGDLFYSKNGEIQESHHTVAREGEQGTTDLYSHPVCHGR